MDSRRYSVSDSHDSLTSSLRQQPEPRLQTGEEHMGDMHSPQAVSLASDGAVSCKEQGDSRNDEDVGKYPNGVCERCSAIPWKSLSSSSDGKAFVIDESISELQQSRCRLCRLLGHYLNLRFTSDLNDQEISEAPQDSPGPSSISPADFHGYPVYYKWLNPLGMMPFSAETRLAVLGDNLSSIRQTIDEYYPKKLDLDQVKGWINNCQSQHGNQCSSHLQGDLRQLKVIDCLAEIVVDAPPNCQYVALSYVWGNTSDDPLGVASNPLHGCPKTIQDAMTLTKGLGYRFLWVDRFCVPQNDAEAKHIQIAQMGDVYAAAHLTIVAAIGSDPNYGLPGVSTTPRSMKVEVLDSSLIAVLPSLLDIKRVHASAWSRRAWTLQESVLSRRRLILTERQAFFACNADVKFESVGKLEDLAIDSSWNFGWLRPGNKGTHMLNAETYLTNYSRRRLSYETDALNAIAGVLNTLRRAMVHHVWGVPFDMRTPSSIEPASTEHDRGLHLRRGKERCISLFWYHPNRAARRSGFPSWSSLGWIGEIGVYYDQVALRPDNIFIRTKSGREDLHSFAPDAESRPEDISQQLELHGETCSVPLANSTGVALPFDRDLFYMVSVKWSVSQTDDLRGIKALLVPDSELDTLGSLLLLRPCEVEEKLCYERIGYASLNSLGQFPFAMDVALGNWFDVDLKPLQALSVQHERLKAFPKDWRWRPQDFWEHHFTQESIILV